MEKTDGYKITFETYNKIASAYQDKFMDLDLYDDTYDLFAQQVEKYGNRIFEIGCGPGNITRYLLNKHPGFKIHAIDVAPNMIRLAEQNNPEAHFEVMDCREIDSLTDKFDGVICGFCMPYLSKYDCSKLIDDAASLLVAGGTLYFSVIEGDYSRSGFESGSSGDQVYVYYHEENFLQEALQAAHFEIKSLIRKPYTKSDGTDSVHLIFIAQKREKML